MEVLFGLYYAIALLKVTIGFDMAILRVYQHVVQTGTNKHIEAEAKWPPISWRHFQIHYIEWK